MGKKIEKVSEVYTITGKHGYPEYVVDVRYTNGTVETKSGTKAYIYPWAVGFPRRVAKVEQRQKQ